MADEDIYRDLARIAGNVGFLQAALKGGDGDQPNDVRMSYRTATSVDEMLRDIEGWAQKIARDIKVEPDANDLLDVIDGLLAAWPTSELVGVYTPGHRSLMKDEAIRRAVSFLKQRNIA